MFSEPVPKSSKIFACLKSVELAEKIAEKYGTTLGEAKLSCYSDGEFQPSLEEPIREMRVFLVRSISPNADNLMELLLMFDVAERASARHITAVMSRFGWARQDRRDKPRAPIGAKLVANLLQAAGITRIMTMDLYADQIQGFFERPVGHFFASSIFLPYLESLNLDKLCVVSPDMGSSKRVYVYFKLLKSEVVICYKQKKQVNVIETMELMGDVEGRNVVLIDDMVDTAGTLVKAAQLMKERGAVSVRTVATRLILSGNAYKRIENSALEELIVADSISLKQPSKKIRVLSCTELFADVMYKVHHNEAISSKSIM